MTLGKQAVLVLVATSVLSAVAIAGVLLNAAPGASEAAGPWFLIPLLPFAAIVDPLGTMMPGAPPWLLITMVSVLDGLVVAMIWWVLRGPLSALARNLSRAA